MLFLHYEASVRKFHTRQSTFDPTGDGTLSVGLKHGSDYRTVIPSITQGQFSGQFFLLVSFYVERFMAPRTVFKTLSLFLILIINI
jgi:hypothetical protein